MTGTPPFTPVAAVGPAPIAATRGPAPVDFGAIAGMQQQDLLARYAGQQQQQSTALGIPTTLAAAYLGRTT